MNVRAGTRTYVCDSDRGTLKFLSMGLVTYDFRQQCACKSAVSILQVALDGMQHDMVHTYA